jgi:hypothetical protein|tara:strand:+ start:438 stop:617 length:180 start_codon:yes stop_codon:yes gene_type:complete
VEKIMKLKEWVLNRKDERTSWDGALLIIFGILILLGSPFVKLAAWVSILYGGWTIWKSE